MGVNVVTNVPSKSRQTTRRPACSARCGGSNAGSPGPPRKGESTMTCVCGAWMCSVGGAAAAPAASASSSTAAAASASSLASARLVVAPEERGLASSTMLSAMPPGAAAAAAADAPPMAIGRLLGGAAAALLASSVTLPPLRRCWRSSFCKKASRWGSTCRRSRFSTCAFRHTAQSKAQVAGASSSGCSASQTACCACCACWGSTTVAPLPPAPCCCCCCLPSLLSDRLRASRLFTAVHCASRQPQQKRCAQVSTTGDCGRQGGGVWSEPPRTIHHVTQPAGWAARLPALAACRAAVGSRGSACTMKELGSIGGTARRYGQAVRPGRRTRRMSRQMGHWYSASTSPAEGRLGASSCGRAAGGAGERASQRKREDWRNCQLADGWHGLAAV